MTTPLTDREAKWFNIRHHRNALLRASDWSQLPDAPISAGRKAAYVSYRQALRDLPQSNPDPDRVTWPVEPE